MLYVRIEKFDQAFNTISNNIIGEFGISSYDLNNKDWRKATIEEQEYHKKGAKVIPKFQIGNAVKVICDKKGELLYHVEAMERSIEVIKALIKELF